MLVNKKKNTTPSVSTSPIPNIPVQFMNFGDALLEACMGKKIRRKSWTDSEVYGTVIDGKLIIHINNEFHTWTVTEGDITGNDWIIA